MDFPPLTSPFIKEILEQEDPVALLILLLDDEKYKYEALWHLSDFKDRRSIVPIIEQAKKDQDTQNAVHFLALTAFNCEEYLKEIFQISLNSVLESKLYTIEILQNIQGMHSKNKKILLSSLELQRELMKNEQCVNIPDLNYISDCIDVITDIPENNLAVIIPFQKKI